MIRILGSCTRIKELNVSGNEINFQDLLVISNLCLESSLEILDISSNKNLIEKKIELEDINAITFNLFGSKSSILEINMSNNKYGQAFWGKMFVNLALNKKMTKIISNNTGINDKIVPYISNFFSANRGKLQHIEMMDHIISPESQLSVLNSVHDNLNLLVFKFPFSTEYQEDLKTVLRQNDLFQKVNISFELFFFFWRKNKFKSSFFFNLNFFYRVEKMPSLHF